MVDALVPFYMSSLCLQLSALIVFRLHPLLQPGRASDVGEIQGQIAELALTLGSARTWLGREIAGHRVGGRGCNHLFELGAKSTEVTRSTNV